MQKPIPSLRLKFVCLWIVCATIAISHAYASTPIKTEALQGLEVRGKVTSSDDNLPIPGVNILIKGTNEGTTTDFNGDYVLVVPSSNAVLVFSFIGLVAQEVTVGARSSINVSMAQDSKQLDEVVVVGYGTQKKASLVGAISQIDSENLKQMGSGITNLAQALTGQLPGVATVQQSGEPGADDPRILIRGQGTWNASQPLILVDGIERRMNDIDIAEVESVSILKDASATAVYGVKGSEGVILITTKRGKIGAPVINVDASMSTKYVSRLPEKFNSYDQLSFYNKVIEYELNSGAAGRWGEYLPQEMLENYRQPQEPGMEYIFPDVDWVDSMLKQFPLSSRLNVSVSGGSQFAKYFTSLSYTYDDDVIKTGSDPYGSGYKSKNTYERINFRTNLDLNVTKSTVFSLNLGGYVGTKTSGFGSGDASLDIFRAFAETAPNEYPIFHEDGAYGFNPSEPRMNPMRAANNRGLGKHRRTNITTDFVLQQNLDFITKGLSARGSLSYDNNFNTTGGIEDGGVKTLYIDPEIVNIREGELPEDYMQGYIHNTSANHGYDWVQGENTYNAEVSTQPGQSSRRLFYQGQINYARGFGKHDVTGLALVNREEFAQGSEFPRYREDWVGRVTYGYDDRYLFETNFAYNGSEKFGPGYRFGFFPSLAVGWVLSNEAFLDYKWLDMLKIRYSVGKVGNDNFSAPRWSYRTTWNLSTDNTYFGNSQPLQSPYNQYLEVALGNPDLAWETSFKQNLGVELGFFENRISASVDVFKDHRTDIFMNAGQRTVAPYLGQSPVAANLGEVEVKGYEAELTLRNRTGGVGYYISANHTGAFDEIIYMEDAPLLPGYLKNAGYPIGQRRVQIDAGFVNNWDEVYSTVPFPSNNLSKLPGDFRILNFSGSGIIDAQSPAPYSYPIDRPQHTYSITLGGDYKGFSVMVQFYGMYNITREYTAYLAVPFYNPLNNGPVMAHHTDMWTPEDPTGRYRFQRLDMQGTPGYGTSFLEDGSFLRLKNAEVAYRFDNRIASRLGLRSLQVYMRGNNLALWSKVIEDREARGDQTVSSVYPLVKRFNLGVNVSF